MEDLKRYYKEDRRTVERIIIWIFALYTFSTLIVAFRDKVSIEIALLELVAYGVGLIVYLFSFKDYKFRACLTAVMVEISSILYAVNSEDLRLAIPILITMIVVLGLYELKEIIYITIAGTTVVIMYHAAIYHETLFEGKSKAILMEMAMIYIVEIVVYFRVKRQIGRNLVQADIIEMLEEAQHGKDDFLTNVSHEIRTPINTICGMSELVLRDELPDRIRKEVFDIQTAGKNLLTVVSDILDFSELSSGKMDMVEEQYNIVTTINDVLNMINSRQLEKGIEVVVDCDVDIPVGLIGDEQKIRRVMMNLIDNAIKFTNEGGIAISVSHRKTEYGINLSVLVEDTGIGMKEESIEKIFKSFSQVDAKRNRQEGGLGLGLAISKALVDKMGGFITVRSELGKGTSIQFVVPQKVADETPILSVDNPEAINGAVWISLEQIHYKEIRDKYRMLIEHIIKQLTVRCYVCRNLNDLKRRSERGDLTHIFITNLEYKQDKSFFDELAKNTKVVIILDWWEKNEVQNSNFTIINKPLYSLPIINALNDQSIIQGAEVTKFFDEVFMAPEAHVLVVDDNVMNIRVVEGLLKLYGVRVSTAESGMSALEKVDNEVYDMIFMDHMMPEMDGIETLHRIRQKKGKYFKNVPVVALTANALGGMREVFYEEGFQDFVPKPVDSTALGRVLKKFLPEDKIIHGADILAPIEDAVSVKYVEGKKVEDELKLDDIDIANGLLYCGNMDNYLEVLRLNLNKGPENKQKIQKFMEDKDWKQYTIHVHGLKSAMASIGADNLSSMAKKLELAGKEENVEYIAANHDDMIAEYDRILAILSSNDKINIAPKEVDTSNLREIDINELKQITDELENATYTFNADNMLKVLDKLDGCACKSHDIGEDIVQVKQKVEMSDFMSAFELFSKLKDSWLKE
ncbi:MAG: response regulator [Lachnospiraceae bacterium]|nr:response regulator [Lachnospiraceae bacterium]